MYTVQPLLGQGVGEGASVDTGRPGLTLRPSQTQNGGSGARAK